MAYEYAHHKRTAFRSTFSWQQSEGGLRRKEADSLKKKTVLTGYAPNENKRIHKRNQKRETPYELLKLENSYGTIAAGSNSKKEIVLLISEKKSYNDVTVTGGNKQLNMSNIEEIQDSDSGYITNRFKPDSSAVAYKSSIQKSPGRVIMDLKETLGNTRQNKSADEIIPFIDEKQDQRYRKEYSEWVNKSGEKNKKVIEDENKKLEHRIEKKKQIENQVQDLVKSSMEKVKQIKKKDTFWIRKREIEELNEDEGKEDEEKNT